MHILGPGTGLACEFGFVTRTLVVQMLLVQEPHFEQQGPDPPSYPLGMRPCGFTCRV